MWLEVLGLLAGGIVGATMISLAVDYFICEDTLADNIEEEYPDMEAENWSLEDVKAFCDKYDIKLTHTEVETTKKDPGKVLTQSRAPGSPIVKGSTLRVEIAKAPTEKPKEESKDDEKPSTESTE